jgi:hypothetical protein
LCLTVKIDRIAKYERLVAMFNQAELRKLGAPVSCAHYANMCERRFSSLFRGESVDMVMLYNELEIDEDYKEWLNKIRKDRVFQMLDFYYDEENKTIRVDYAIAIAVKTSKYGFGMDSIINSKLIENYYAELQKFILGFGNLQKELQESRFIWGMLDKCSLMLTIKKCAIKYHGSVTRESLEMVTSKEVK